MTTNDMPAHEAGAAVPAKLQHTISGGDLPYIDITLPAGGTFVTEPGAMMSMDDGVHMDTVLGDGSQDRGFFGRLWNAIKRPFSGESMFSVVFTNPTDETLAVTLAAPYPGTVMAVDLEAAGGSLICQRGAYMGGSKGTRVGVAFQKRIRVGLFGGEGFLMQRLEGTGIVFVHAGGSLVEHKLTPGQALRVDSGCLAALQASVTYDIKYAGKIKTAFFGGEGLFFANVTGPGSVWLQSMPLKRLSASVVGPVLTGNNGRGGGLWGKVYLLFIIAIFLIAVFGSGEL